MDGWVRGGGEEGREGGSDGEKHKEKKRDEDEVRVWLSESSCMEDTVGGSGRVVGELRV